MQIAPLDSCSPLRQGHGAQVASLGNIGTCHYCHDFHMNEHGVEASFDSGTCNYSQVAAGGYDCNQSSQNLGVDWAYRNEEVADQNTGDTDCIPDDSGDTGYSEKSR